MPEIIGLACDRETGIYTSTGVHIAPGLFDTRTYIRKIIAGVNGRIAVFSKLDWDVAALARIIDLTDAELETIAQKESVRIRPDHKVTYFPEKYFGLDEWSPAHKGARFYDACQYDQTLSEIQVRHDSEYWFDRARKAAAAGQETADRLSDLGYDVETLSSPATVFSKNVMAKMKLPVHSDCPEEANKYAYQTITGNWVEAFKLGHYDNVIDYDINSAYCYQALQLLDTRRGKWIQSKDYQPDARYGYARCIVYIDSPISPIIYQALEDDSAGIDDRNYTPCGEFEAYLTKGMIDFINNSPYPELKTSYATVLDGWWWFQDKNQPEYTPLKGIVNNLFRQKQSATGPAREIIKRIMNGAFYGVFSQMKREVFGEYFFPVWAAEIESNNRIMVAKACLDSGVIPLHIAVDGILADKPLNVKIGEEMGEWKISHQGKALIINTNARFIEGKTGDRHSSLSYDRIIKQIAENPAATEYQQSNTKVITILEAVKNNRPGEIGKIDEVTAALCIDSETKRLYMPAPYTGADIIGNHYESIPMSIERLMLNEELKQTSLKGVIA